MQQMPSMPSMPAMRGPKPVDEYLKDIQRDAFSRGGGDRVELVSNASENDNDIADLGDDGSVFAPDPPPAARGPRAPRKTKR